MSDATRLSEGGITPEQVRHAFVLGRRLARDVGRANRWPLGGVTDSAAWTLLLRRIDLTAQDWSQAAIDTWLDAMVTAGHFTSVGPTIVGGVDQDTSARWRGLIVDMGVDDILGPLAWAAGLGPAEAAAAHAAGDLRVDYLRQMTALGARPPLDPTLR